MYVSKHSMGWGVKFLVETKHPNADCHELLANLNLYVTLFFFFLRENLYVTSRAASQVSNFKIYHSKY
jgi:hypothetical protein